MNPRVGKTLLLVAVAILILTLAGVGLTYTSTPQFCRTCHLMAPYYQSWKRSAHKGVNCLACHQEPGLAGSLLGKAQGLRNLSLASAYWRRFRPMRSRVSNAACLGCHSNVARRLFVWRQVKIRHKDFLELPCQTCHPVGHLTIRRPRSPKPVCLLCHNDRVAPRSCPTCHVGDIGAPPRRQYPKVEL